MKKKPAALKRKAAVHRVTKTIVLPVVGKNETYKGMIVDERGKPLHHVIEIASQSEGGWDNARKLAQEAGAALPSRREGGLLRASDPKGQSGWFWLDEQYEGGGGYAWAQSFGGGYQFSFRKSNESRVRLVRRVLI